MGVAIMIVLIVGLFYIAYHQSPLPPLSHNGSGGTTPPTTQSPSSTAASGNDSVALPLAPHGLFVAMFPGKADSTDYAAISQNLINNPIVDGADIFVVWAQVDKGPAANPKYDWAPVDKDMQAWIAAGKKVNLIVWAVSEGGAANIGTPSYVLASVPTVSCAYLNQEPVYWNPAYMSAYQKFMAALIEHYGTNPSVGYIRFGLGTGGETYLPCQKQLTASYGFSTQVWERYIFSMLDYEKSLNAPKWLVVGTNNLDPNSASPDYSFPDAVAARAEQDGIGIGNQGWQLSDISNFASGTPCNADWCGNFDTYFGHVPLYLQTLGKTDPANASPTGSLVNLMPFALHHHAQIFEIYYQDWFVGYDPNDPFYAQYHAAYQQALTAAHNAVD